MQRIPSSISVLCELGELFDRSLKANKLKMNPEKTVVFCVPSSQVWEVKRHCVLDGVALPWKEQIGSLVVQKPPWRLRWPQKQLKSTVTNK